MAQESSDIDMQRSDPAGAADQSKFTIGLDFGSNSVRAVVVDVRDGRELGTGVCAYPSGEKGILLDPSDHNLARQNPEDYLEGMRQSVCDSLEDARSGHSGFSPENVIGIAVAGTGSSPIPVDEGNRALASDSRMRENLNAQCWLWKDHTSVEEAKRITEVARRERPQYLDKCGGTYSSEWFWAKIWHCAQVDPNVFEAAYSWVELCDWIPSVLAGVTQTEKVKRGVCAAGHKALYSEDWNGLPDKDFLSLLDPRLAELRDRLFDEAFDASGIAGYVSEEWSEVLGIPKGIPIGIGALDVHFGAIGAGVSEGTLVKVIGTSSCDCAVAPSEAAVPDIPGICGIVPGSILPKHFGIEAGQSAVGDIFAWFVERVCLGDGQTHAKLTEGAARLRPGESGLLALDWNNGNRSLLVDPMLTGLLVGQTLHSTRAEIYRTLIEATAFGARKILERIEEYGVKVDRIVCAGGIAEKNEMLMQIYADVTARELRISSSSQTCALGGAIVAAVIAGEERGGHNDFDAAQAAMSSLGDTSFKPDPERAAVYDEIYKLYSKVHDAFAANGETIALDNVMKDLLSIKEKARKRSS